MTPESIYVLTNTQDTRTYNSNDPADYAGQTNGGKFHIGRTKEIDWTLVK